jgi:hypothetical protein
MLPGTVNQASPYLPANQRGFKRRIAIVLSHSAMIVAALR